MTGGSSMGYSVTKAAGLHLMKHFAYSLGPKIRVNAVLPGLLLTEWVGIYLLSLYSIATADSNKRDNCMARKLSTV